MCERHTAGSNRPSPVRRSTRSRNFRGNPACFLLGSRYCDTRSSFCKPRGSYSNRRLPGGRVFRQSATTSTIGLPLTIKTPLHPYAAAQAYEERTGVCRDYAHLAITFCRCMNIPARYCTGYLSDIGASTLGRRAISPPGLRSTSAGGGICLTRGNNVPRIGRVLIGTRPRCFRRRHRNHVRPEYPRKFQGLDG